MAINSFNKPTVLAVGLFIPGTGFTRVLESLFAELSDHFAIHWMGIGYKGAVTAHKNYTLHPVNVKGGDVYGAYGAAQLAIELNAESILLLTDLYLLKNYQKPLAPLKEKGIKLLAYVPLDGYITDVAITAQCFFLDEMVLYNKWAMQEVRSAIDKYTAEQASPLFTTPVLSYAYHGTDTVAFSSPSMRNDKEELKTELFKVDRAADAVFILNANRFNERKDIETTIAAFAKALPRFNKPGYLCLHTPNLAADLKTNLMAMIEDSGCKENILLNPLGENYCTDEQLTDLYSACAIGINTSLGEGWGMISFEHAACGAAQVVPNHTAPAEVWKDVGVLIPLVDEVQLSTNPFLMYCTNANIVSRELVKLVNDEAYLSITSAACLAHVKKEMFSWENIAIQWIAKLNAPISICNASAIL